jgi:hypothetical protein
MVRLHEDKTSLLDKTYDGVDTSITIESILIRNANAWREQKAEEIVCEPTAKVTMMIKKNRKSRILDQENGLDQSTDGSNQLTLSFKRGMKMTFHRMNECARAFPDLVNAKQFIYSLNPDQNAAKVFMAGEGAGRSGSFFFFSHDNRFIIKTLT